MSRVRISQGIFFAHIREKEGGTWGMKGLMNATDLSIITQSMMGSSGFVRGLISE